MWHEDTRGGGERGTELCIDNVLTIDLVCKKLDPTLLCCFVWSQLSEFHAIKMTHTLHKLQTAIKALFISRLAST